MKIVKAARVSPMPSPMPMPMPMPMVKMTPRRRTPVMRTLIR